MTFDTTLGNLKKRIFDLLYEFKSDDDTVVICDTDRNLLLSKLPDAVNGALAVMYESLPTGISKSAQRVYRHREVAYDRCFPEGERSESRFYTPVADTAVYFKFFGYGNMIFWNQNDEYVYEITCNGTESLSEMRALVNLQAGGVYTVSVDGTLKIYDFTVYDGRDVTDEGSLSCINELSFALPQDFGSFKDVFAGPERLDTDEISVCGGFGFVKKSRCGSCGHIELEYRKKPQPVDTDTTDSFAYDLSPLEFEALICLSASELCRENDAAKHTRLMYKYNDLAEGLRSRDGKIRRNGFFRARRGMR